VSLQPRTCHAVTLITSLTLALGPNRLADEWWSAAQRGTEFPKVLHLTINAATAHLSGVHAIRMTHRNFSAHMLSNSTLRLEDVRGSECTAPDILQWSASSPCRFTAGVRSPVAHWIRGWVGLEPVWTTWRRETSCRYRDSKSDPSAVKPAASCISD
jgi:hypothetical protein